MVWKLSVRRKRNDCTVPKVHIEAGGKDDHVESNATRRAMPSVRMSTATAAASTSTSGIQSTGVSTSVSPTGSPTVDSGDHPGALRAHLGRCVDTCLANMQTDPRLQSIQSTMDMMRLQMLVLGLASGSTSVQGSVGCCAAQHEVLFHTNTTHLFDNRFAQELCGWSTTSQHGYHSRAHGCSGRCACA